MKKAQGLPITVIIIAALGLAILAILLWAVLTKMKYFGTGVETEAGIKACEPDNGKITSVIECTDPLLGNYGKKDATGKIVPLAPYEACCKKS